MQEFQFIANNSPKGEQKSVKFFHSFYLSEFSDKKPEIPNVTVLELEFFLDSLINSSKLGKGNYSFKRFNKFY